MTRLIDADALRDKLQAEIDKGIPPFDDVMGSIRCGIRLARNIVEDEPTIDAIPIEWLIRMRNKHNNDGFAWIYEAVMDDWREEHAKTD